MILLGGQVQLYFAGITSSIQYIRAGQLRALAVTTAARSPALPHVPSLSEVLPGYEASFWGGFCAPKGMPAEIVEKLNQEINAGLADPKIKARLADLGGTALAGSPADFGKPKMRGGHTFHPMIRRAISCAIAGALAATPAGIYAAVLPTWQNGGEIVVEWALISASNGFGTSFEACSGERRTHLLLS